VGSVFIGSGQGSTSVIALCVGWVMRWSSSDCAACGLCSECLAV